MMQMQEPYSEAHAAFSGARTVTACLTVDVVTHVAARYNVRCSHRAFFHEGGPANMLKGSRARFVQTLKK